MHCPLAAVRGIYLLALRKFYFEGLISRLGSFRHFFPSERDMLQGYLVPPLEWASERRLG